MSGSRVAGLPLDLAERVLEPLVRERLDLAAAVADQVMMVDAVAVSGLESRDRVPDVDPLDETLIGQEVEDSVDARDADAAALGP